MTDEFNRCLACAKPSCVSACPIGNNIPRFLRKVKLGEYVSATETIGHPFGEICGYVCPRDKQCQGGCVLSKRGNPVLIGEVEKTVFAEYPYQVKRRGNALDGIKIAVVGGGVCGITFAVKTYEQGANVTVFERDKLLSTLRLIPAFRLPAQAIERVERALGGKIEIANKTVDRSFMLELRRKYDVVLASTGATVNYGLGVEGSELATDYKNCLAGNYTGRNVVVVGGGNSAMDCARFVVSRGGKATVVYRRTEQDMPAFESEVANAKRENVRFVFNAAPTRLEQSDGKLKLTYARTVSEGRGKLTVTNELSHIACDCVVTATGSKFDDSILENSKNANSLFQYGNVWIGGDSANGKLVADAVRDGLLIAQKIINDSEKICSSTK